MASWTAKTASKFAGKIIFTILVIANQQIGGATYLAAWKASLTTCESQVKNQNTSLIKWSYYLLQTPISTDSLYLDCIYLILFY